MKPEERITQLDTEIERRIREMETDPDALPKRFSRGNYIVLGFVVALCLLAVLYGAR